MFFIFLISKIFFFKGPVVKQTIITENISDESSSESEKIQQEKSAESPVTNDQQILPTDSIDEHEKKDEEQEQTDDQPQNIKIELKDPSACKSIFSF
jgi:hypothetical protein